jgi:hypothetical protein
MFSAVQGYLDYRCDGKVNRPDLDSHMFLRVTFSSMSTFRYGEDIGYLPSMHQYVKNDFVCAESVFRHIFWKVYL